ncbi:MAG: sigma-70 family RNA polymerase sigma factor [Bacteroidota bacterium]
MNYLQQEQTIRQGGKKSRQVVNRLFSEWDYLINLFNSKYRTLFSREEVSDIYTDVYLLYVRLVKEGKFSSNHQHAAVGFIKKTMRFRIIDAMRIKGKQPFFDEIGEISNLILDPTKESIDRKLIQDCLDTLPEQGKEILTLWSKNYPMEEIANRMGLASANSAAVTKCHAVKAFSKIYRDNLSKR